MKRLLAAALLAGTFGFAVVPAHAADVPTPGGTCSGAVDVMCRRPCTDELDCGLIPPCFLWLAYRCAIG